MSFFQQVILYSLHRGVYEKVEEVLGGENARYLLPVFS